MLTRVQRKVVTMKLAEAPQLRADTHRAPRIEHDKGSTRGRTEGGNGDLPIGRG